MKNLLKLDGNEYLANTKGKSIAYFPSKKKNNRKNFGISKASITKLVRIYKKYQIPFRLGLHLSNDEKIHYMMIVIGKKDLTDIHKHLYKDEMYFIHHGKFQIECYENKKNKKINKKKIHKVTMDKNSYQLFKLSKNNFHKTIPKSEVVIFTEIRKGPFIKTDSILFKK
tara:strand:+ start:1547 stop:2053 length:507 start_codon:yes stop_codon:yes gene_type:complete